MIHLFIDIYCYNIITETDKFYILLNYILYEQKIRNDSYFYKTCEIDNRIIIDIIDDNIIIEFIDDVINIDIIDGNNIVIDVM